MKRLIFVIVSAIGFSGCYGEPPVSRIGTIPSETKEIAARLEMLDGGYNCNIWVRLADGSAAYFYEPSAGRCHLFKLSVTLNAKP